MAPCLPSKGAFGTGERSCALQRSSSCLTQPLLSFIIKAPAGYELCLWLQNWQTKILPNCYKGKAFPMLRANKLPSNCMQTTAMAQSTRIIYSRNSEEGGRRETRDGGGVMYSPNDTVRFHGLWASIQPLLLPRGNIISRRPIASCQKGELRNGIVVSHSFHCC